MFSSHFIHDMVYSLYRHGVFSLLRSSHFDSHGPDINHIFPTSIVTKDKLQWEYCNLLNEEVASQRRQAVEINIWMICWRMKNVYMKRWYNYRAYRMQKRMRMEYIICRGEVCRILHYLRRWRLYSLHLSQLHQRISRATYKQGNRYQNLIVFLGKLTRYLYKMKSRHLLKN